MAASDPPLSPPSEPGLRRRRWRRRGTLKPRAWEVRLAISIPAVFVLLTISAGLSHYLVVQNMAGRLEALGTPGRADPLLAGARGVAAQGVERSLVVLLVFTGLALLGGVGLALSILVPLREVIDATATVARGQPHEILKIRAGFELGELGRSFNSMVDFVNSMIDQREALLNDDSLPASLSVDADGRVTSASTACLEILSATRESTMGRTIEELRRRDPRLAPPLLDFCQECVASLAPARDFSAGARSFSAMVPDKPVEIDLPGPGGGAARTVSVSCALLRDARNVPNGVLFHFRDAAQLRSLHELFSRTDQLAALGTFTMGLAHELRNPLGSLKGAAQLLAERMADREEARPYLERIAREVSRVDRLVRELFDFSSAPIAPESPHDLGALAHQALEHAERGMDPALREGKRVVEEYAPGLPRVLLQEARVVQAVVNVVTNAFEHMPPGCELTLRTSTLTGGSTGPVALDVTNTGSSIAPEDFERVFEPFFSTRRGGTGLGLSIAYQIVLQNHGQLAVTNVPGGVCFRFVFRKLAAQ